MAWSLKIPQSRRQHGASGSFTKIGSWPVESERSTEPMPGQNSNRASSPDLSQTSTGVHLPKEHDRTTSEPVFVVGTPRSGTTLTAQILGRHSTLFIPGENHFFEDIYVRWSPRWSGATPQERSSMVERLATIYGRYNQLEDQPRIDALLARDPELRERLAASGRLAKCWTVLCAPR